MVDRPRRDRPRRPGAGTGPGSIDRPDRPGGGTKPGGGSKPGGVERPDRPGGGTKPGGVDRPDRPGGGAARMVTELGPVTVETFTVPDRFGFEPGDSDLRPPRPEFDGLDARLPLLLLPVRLETKYRLDLDPPELRIRIYPEQVHIDSEAGEPTEVDLAAATDYWEQVVATRDVAQRRALWRAFARTVGQNRAGHIARTTRPELIDGDLVFPKVAVRDGQRPSTAVFLPDRWVVHGYRGDARMFNVAGATIPTDLQTSPDADDLGVTVEASGLQVSDRMAWMVDYDAAVEVGMAVTVDLGTVDNPEVPFSTVLAFGVHEADDPVAEADRFEEVLAMHQRTSGLAFVPAGTPTNNTPEAEAGWTRTEQELDELFDREWGGVLDDLPLGPPFGSPGGPSTEPPIDRPTGPGGRPPPTGRPTNASRLSDVLGLADDTVLQRSAFGRDDERGRSADMNRVLFEPMLGRYLRDMLAIDDVPTLDDATIEAAEAYFAERVTGGPWYPTVLVGPQPYGILPMTLPGPGRDDTETQWVKTITGYVRDEWRAAVDAVPTLDPDATDALGDGEPIDALPAVLASLPNPARIFGRTFYADDDSSLGSLFGLEGLYRFSIDTVLPISHPDFADVTDLWGYSGDNEQMASLGSIDEQINAWEVMRDYLERGDFAQIDDDEREAAIAFIDGLMVLLQGFELRQRPHRFLDIPGWAGILGHPANELISGRFSLDADEWTGPAIVGRPDDPETHQPAAYLNDLATRLEGTGPVGASTMPAEFLAEQPLLYQLIDNSLSELAGNRRTATRASLLNLAGEDPSELDRLLRETLGLVTYRLDAWNTALARRQVDGLREGEPRGLQIGGFGWVLDLGPSEGRTSNGFVHAPSLNHAATASVLRSAWLANGNAAPTSTAAVQVESARVRTAEWVLDGIRNGQPLGELLGYRFERGLHDAGLASEILDVRLAVIAAVPDSDATEDEAVDGLELLHLWRDGGLAPYLGGLANNRLRFAMEGRLDALEEVFDAIGDVALFEGTHQVIQGNSERAAAMFDAVSLGTGPPPELRAARTGTEGTTIDHRVVVVVADDSAPNQPPPDDRGWIAGVRDQLAPALERFVQQLLPPAGEIGLVIDDGLVDDGLVDDGTARTATTFQAEGFSALDAVLGDRLTLLAVLRARRGLSPSARLAPDQSGDAAFSLADFEAIAAELRALLADAQPAASDVLRQPLDDRQPVADYGAIDPAVDGLLDRLGQALGVGPHDADWETLARFGWTAGRDPVAAHGLLVDRLSTAKAVGGDGQPRTRDDRVAALMTQAPPLLPRFVATADHILPGDELAPADDMVDWLDAMGRVRSGVGRVTTAGLLAGLVDAPGFEVAAGQNSRQDSESWAALHRPPAGTGDRLCVTAVGIGGAMPRVGDQMVALLVDRWAERIPNDDQVTGVGFHFDAPSNRPPQAWLLATPETGRSWSEDAVVDLLFETLDWATMRMVGPEDLRSYGHGLPTAYAGRTLIPWAGDEPEVGS